MPWEWPVGALCALLVALVTTPAGVSGAVLLLPVQLSLLGVPSPAVTPTNLVFNVGATPGGLLRFWREQRLTNSLTGLLVAGTLPGVVAGAVIRVELLAGERAFMLVAAGVLLPLGLWLLVGAQRLPRARPAPTARTRHLIWLLALVVGTVGGIYGIGGGSLLAPLLLAAGFSAYQVAPATLAATFLTSIVGVASYELLQLDHGGSIAPDWALGAWLATGGFLGSYLGARLQHRLSESALRRLLGAIACLVAARYLQQAVDHGPKPREAQTVALQASATGPSARAASRTPSRRSAPDGLARERRHEPRQVAARASKGVLERRGGVWTMHAGAVADQHVLRLHAAQRGRRPGAQQRVDAELAGADREGLVAADHLGHDQRPLLGPPERGLAPVRDPNDGDRLEGRLRHDVGHPQVRHLEAGRERRAVAVVAVEQLQHGSRLAKCRHPLDRLGLVDRIDHPDSPVRHERVRGALHAVVQHPAEAKLELVEADAAHVHPQ